MRLCLRANIISRWMNHSSFFSSEFYRARFRKNTLSIKIYLLSVFSNSSREWNCSNVSGISGLEISVIRWLIECDVKCIFRTYPLYAHTRHYWKRESARLRYRYCNFSYRAFAVHRAIFGSFLVSILPLSHQAVLFPFSAPRSKYISGIAKESVGIHVQL